MNCHDAREGLSARFHSEMGLTEWALLDAHVRQCVECRKERESLLVGSSRHQVTPAPALLHCLSKMTDAIHFGTTSVAVWPTRLRVLLSIFLTVSGQASVRVIEASRVGATRLVGLLTRVSWLLPKLFKLSVRAAAFVIEATGVVITRFVVLLARLRWSLMIAFQGAGRAAVRVVEAARAGVAWPIGRLTRVRWLLPILFTLSVRAAASLIGPIRFVITRFAHLLIWLRLSLMIAFQWARRAAIKAIRAGVTRVLDLVMRVRCLVPVLLKLSEHAAANAIGATWVVGRIVMTTSGRALSFPGLSAWISTTCRRGGNSRTREKISGPARTHPLRQRIAAAWTSRRSTEPSTRDDMTSGTRSLLRVCTGIASLAILVAAVLFLWPREWPDKLMLRPSTGERLSQDVRPPADRNPAEPAAGAQLAETRTPKPVSAPQPAPPAVSQPETQRVAMRPKPPEPQAEIPAPSRNSDPALAGSPATGLAPILSAEEATWSRERPRPQESARAQDGAGSQNAEASDASAPIDWLLKGGRGTSRRYIESP